MQRVNPQHTLRSECDQIFQTASSLTRIVISPRVSQPQQQSMQFVPISENVCKQQRHPHGG